MALFGTQQNISGGAIATTKPLNKECGDTMTECDPRFAEYIYLGSSELAERSFCHRIFCWPCDSTRAICAALSNGDCVGIFKVLCCCPVSFIVCTQMSCPYTQCSLIYLCFRYCHSAELAVDGAQLTPKALLYHKSKKNRKRFLTPEFSKWKRKREKS